VGSVTLLRKRGNSAILSGSTAYYLPFGSYRGTPPSQTITDRSFTGQKENMEIGLLYYNARYYVPSIGRFASADTLIPNPTNPQSFNRYSYVDNQPMNYTDPTGHCKNGRGVGIGTCQVDGGPGFADGSLIPLGDNVPQVLTSDELGSIGNALSVVPYLDTGDDLLTTFTGCGYACQAGTEEPVGVVWRVVAGVGIVAPFGSSVIRHGLDEIGDVFQYLGSYADDIFQELTGQWHHVLSNKIFNALGQHETLADVFGRNDILVQALDGPSHTGYQTWHRLYDDEVVEWLENPVNEKATAEQFLQFLRSIYERPDMQERFPGATQLIDMVMEELQ
jgi:RHS repeat-associated protein